MKALNYIEIETKSGYKSFELHCGDITNLDFNVDLLVLSAFSRSYKPVKGTVIGALYNKGIDVEKLAEDCQYDFRNCFGTWISKEISDQTFRQIICIEIVGTNFNIEEAIKNLFTTLSVLEVRRLQIHSIVLPLIGTGEQKQDAKKIISTLVDLSLEFLQHSRFLEKIAFVEYNESKAERLNEEMDTVLGRTKIKVPRGPLVEEIKKEIIGNIEKIIRVDDKNEIFLDLRTIINSSYCRTFELGGISRKLVEFIVYDLSPAEKHFELWKKIDSLSSIGIAQWILGYMHILRVFGNEAVHDKKKNTRNPESINEKDLELCLFCILRVVDFYYSIKRQNARVFNYDRELVPA
jgi:O-acetyl-ADP-ribose deacetylase (regulator of RNase III)